MRRWCAAACWFVAACYDANVVDCAYLCGDGDRCPDGTSCDRGLCRVLPVTGDCPGDLCGNDFMDAGEDCDDNDDDSDGCAACKFATCGDGYVRAGDEQCDDANADSEDGCIDCNWAYCGDGTVRAGVEHCEPSDGNCTDACVSCAGTGVWGDGADHHCYRRVGTSLTYAQAQAQCTLVEGHLYTAANQAERDTITAMVLDPGATEAWIGLHQPVMNGPLVWITGAPFGTWSPQTYVDENGTIPEDCFVQAASTGYWSDYVCSVSRPFVCETAPWTIETIDNHAYKVFYAVTTHDDASSACNGRAPRQLAHLATLDEPRELALVQTIAFLEVWVGGPGCKVLTPNGAIVDRPCTEMHPFMCEVD